MKVLNDFCCTACGNIDERLLENHFTTAVCQNCGGVSKKKRAIPNFKLPGTDPAYPTAYDQWNKKREQKLAEERKKADPAEL